MTADITKLVTLILGISISGERLVTLVKTICPELAAPPASSTELPADTKQEKANKVILMLIAFACCTITAFLMNDYSFKDINVGKVDVPLLLLALLASGGSAFWTNILGYVSSLKDLSGQKAVQAKLAIREQLTGTTNPTPDLLKKKLTNHAEMPKTISFSTVFSGGPGSLKIKINGYSDLDFTGNETKTIDLPPGGYIYSAAGFTAAGDGGSCVLTIDGDVIADSPQNYPAGNIASNSHPIFVKP